MQNLALDTERRTTTDLVFDQLHDDINTMKLPPGTRLSEVDIAQQFGVSRQPVRDAFFRLSNLELLLIRPQKATIVRGFSEDSIASARFIRLAVELEVMNCACKSWEKEHSKKVHKNLDLQAKAIKAEQWDEFHKLDLQFHALICELSDTHYAIETIQICRQKTDRLCSLSLNREKEVDVILKDHYDLVAALEQGKAQDASHITRLHLSRIDPIIKDIRSSHAEYFDTASLER